MENVNSSIDNVLSKLENSNNVSFQATKDQVITDSGSSSSKNSGDDLITGNSDISPTPEIVDLESIEKSKKDIDKKENLKNRIIGIVIVILIAIFLSASSELSQFILVSSYNKPFVTIYFNTAVLSLSIPIELLLIKFKDLKKPENSHYTSVFQFYKDRFNFDFKTSSSSTTTPKLDSTSINSDINDSNTTTSSSQPIVKYSAKKMLISSLLMSILFVLLNVVWMEGLTMTEVSTSSALYQSATIWVFLFSIFILKEKITILKCISVVLFIAGVVGITLADMTSEDHNKQYPNAVTGDILMIISAVLWALYEVMTTKLVGNLNRTVVHTFLGLVGLYDMVLGIPVIFILSETGFEPFAFPTPKTFGMMLLNTAFSFGLNYLVNWGLSITSPLFVRAGELMCIPTTLVFDLIVKHIYFPLVSIPGFLLIVAGFILSVYIENKHLKSK
ncbi:hypothetical protein DLAC_06443 [Tieghemostelium lacteum]|uniref:EamA domain-containing protein n=1 Tax=Tieghemostelium lacteum TaxID=361077 RepID=A0A151ZEX3_TIELA|nr:hypothetical protein DLAC_06443 [Tieghemostelium lacteum]|eukprot:KYQ92460.1 hypothetical protein DLAC_06443 [Tieghemostelium lacteum]